MLLILLGAIPWSRYALAGLVLKKDISLHVVDSTAGTPVSGADVQIGSVHSLTNANGSVTLHSVKVGSHVAQVTKKYYKNAEVKVLIPILTQKNPANVKMAATGRQVKVTVNNLISHEALSNVNIKVADITAKTDKTGSAIIVLPIGKASEKASLQLDGYNDSSVNINVDDKTIKENKF